MRCAHAAAAMILAVMVVNNFGRGRLLKFYSQRTAEQQQQVVKDLFNVLSARTDGLSVERPSRASKCARGTRVVYRQYATLYFCVAIDASEIELGMLDFIQVFVEVLDRHFKNVCELDVIFNSEQVHWILDEMITGGLVLETNIQDILDAVESQARLARQSGDSVLGAAPPAAAGRPPGPTT